MGEVSKLFAIYDHPRDYPQNFVVREWRIGQCFAVPNEKAHAIVATIEEARASIPPGYMRSPILEQDPKIVEVWL